MATATPSKARKASKPDTTRLTLTIRGVAYTVRFLKLDTGSDLHRLVRLRKADGTTYHVSRSYHGDSCDCGDQTFRHEGLDNSGCKHIRSLRAHGLLE